MYSKYNICEGKVKLKQSFYCVLKEDVLMK